MLQPSRYIAKLFIPHLDDVRNPDVRSQYGLLEGWVSIVMNLVLAVVKLMLGVSLTSAGLVADALHSLSDMLTSVVVILGFRVSRKPPDAEHPFGHAKAEYVATLIVAILLVVAGVELGQQNAYRLWRGDLPQDGAPLTWWLLLVLLLLVGAKELLAAFSTALGRIIDSSALAADAWHHRTDSISTALVILGLWGRNLGFHWLDSVAGALVALFIIYAGIKLALDSISPLLGEAVPPETLAHMKDIAAGVEHVANMHDMLVHRYGHFYFTTVHVEISDALDPHQMHEVTVKLETRILKAFPGQCVVHVDPLSLDHPKYNDVADALRNAVIAHPELVEFRDLNLWSRDGREFGKVELSAQPYVEEAQFPKIKTDITAKIAQIFPEIEFSVTVKVDFSATPMEHGNEPGRPA